MRALRVITVPAKRARSRTQRASTLTRPLNADHIARPTNVLEARFIVITH